MGVTNTLMKGIEKSDLLTPEGRKVHYTAEVEIRISKEDSKETWIELKTLFSEAGIDTPKLDAQTSALSYTVNLPWEFYKLFTQDLGVKIIVDTNRFILTLTEDVIKGTITRRQSIKSYPFITGLKEKLEDIEILGEMQQLSREGLVIMFE